MWLVVQCGLVWVMCSNDVDDYFLVDGEMLKLCCGEWLWFSVEGCEGVCVVFLVLWLLWEVVFGGLIWLC